MSNSGNHNRLIVILIPQSREKDLADEASRMLSMKDGPKFYEGFLAPLGMT